MAAPIKAAPSVLAAEIRPFLEIGVANGRRGYVETRAGCSARITHAPNQSNLRAGDLPGLPKCAYGRSQHGTRARKRQRRINAVCQDQCKGGPAMPRDGANVQSLAVIAFLVYVHLGPTKWQPPRTGLGWQMDHFLGYVAGHAIVWLAWPRPFVVGQPSWPPRCYWRPCKL
jgi:hypothetical protein